MATITSKRTPNGTLESAYRPVKYVVEVYDSSSVDAFKSVKFEVQAVEGGVWVDKATIRVQEDIDTTGYTGTDTYFKIFSVDISSIARNDLSFDLRPLIHDTDATGEESTNFKIKQDITQSQIAHNVSKEYRVKATAEYIDANGDYATGTTLTMDTAVITNASFPLYYNARGTYHLSDYWHYSTRTTSNFLTNEPLTSYIREDECQYLSVFAHSGNTGASVYEILARIYFYDFDDSLIGTYSMRIDKLAEGDGTYSLGLTGDRTENKTRVCQLGVGTRNIMSNTQSWNGTKPTNWDGVKYYTVQMFYKDSPEQATSVVKKYIINRETEPTTGFVRFHWQNRLGGIDSYTCKGGTMEEISRKSSVYQQNTYKNFTRDMGISAGTISDHQAVSDGIGGNMDVSRHGITVGSVDYSKSFSAVSRPLNKSEAIWLEELFTSANVWVEIPIQLSALPYDQSANNQLVPVVMKDGSTSVVDSEGLVTMEFKYTLSNNTIIPHN